MSHLHVLALFMGCVLLVLAPNVPKGQQRKDSMTLLTTTPHSMEEKGVFRKNRKCRRLKKGYEAKHKEWLHRRSDQADGNPQPQAQIQTLGIEYYRAKQLYRKTCKTRTTKAAHEGFRDTIHKLQIELRVREVQTSVYKYPTQEDLEGHPDVPLKALREETTLSSLLEKSEDEQKSILELYQTEGIGAESGSGSQLTSEERGVLEAVANRKMRRKFADFYDTVLTDGHGQFVPDPLQEPEETEVLDLVFSHYYHIQKQSASRYTLGIHLFLMDATQRDPNTKLYPVYNQKTETTPWRQRPTDYVGNLSKELSYVVEEFAASGK